MKLIAFYLPQFHLIPENEEMWGKGFTDWVNVKNAKPMFEWHKQPVEPLNDNYYDLLDINVMKWQTDLAKKYGIYGFCMYHYWYNGHLLLEKPVENYLRHPEVDFPYCLCWANHDWGYSWVYDNKVIYKQEYNDKKEWYEHFMYFLPFFKDERYMKDNNGSPILIIYDVIRDNKIQDMLEYWNVLARENGFENGLSLGYQHYAADSVDYFDDSIFSYNIEYQPMYARTFASSSKSTKRIYSILRYINDNTFKIKMAVFDRFKKDKVTILDYDDIWKKINSMPPVTSKSVPGAFINEDTTPRKKTRGLIVKGMTLDKFYKYFKKQIIHAREDYKSDMLFLFAWNEWAEGAYMEPDKHNEYGVLEIIYRALKETNELPQK